MKRAANLLLGAILGIAMNACRPNVVPVAPPVRLFPQSVPANICYLRTTRVWRVLGVGTKYYNATGTLFDGQYLVTAAHNLYDNWRTKVVGVQVSCRSEEGTVVTSVLREWDVRATRKTKHYDKGFSTDYAFLRLKRKLPVAESLTLDRGIEFSEIGEVEVAGYPGRELQHGKGKLVRRDLSQLRYEVDTAQGMSGGPVWPAAGQPHSTSLIGIHVGEGRARVVDEELIDDFEGWKAGLK